MNARTDADLRTLAAIERTDWALRTGRIARSDVPTAMHVNIGIDIMSPATLQFANGFQGTTATASTATTWTCDANNITVNSVVGQYIVAWTTNIRFGIIQSNTSATNSVLTIDRWYDASALPANVAVAAASTPAAGGWMILPGNVPAAYIGLSASVTGPAVTDTTLASELTTAGGGLTRQLATYAHSAASAGAGTATLIKTFTMNGSDTGGPFVIHQMGVFQGVVAAASRMMFRTVLSADATMTTSGDQLALTETVSMT